MSNEVHISQYFPNSDLCQISDLGRKGLTWNWSNMELNKRYLLNLVEYIRLGPTWDLEKDRIMERAQELNADVYSWQDHLGLYLCLRPKVSA